MKSALQIQLDNSYEILRVVYTKKREAAAALVRSLPARPILQQPVKNVPTQQVQSANWDVAWFNHYE